MTLNGRCKFKKTNDLLCEAWAMHNCDFCFTHNPETKDAKLLAVKRGGKSPKKNYTPLQPIEMKSNKDVVKLISQTINEVREGIIDIRVANCVFYGSGQLIRALESANIEERVVKIEETLSRMNVVSPYE